VIYGLLRIKNEARWIDRVITSLWPVCEKILVFDDHSTDDTVAICRKLGCQVFESPFTGLDETRDKDYLLDRLWERQAKVGDYVIMVDGDEELMAQDVPLLLEYLKFPYLHCGSFRVLYLWDNEHQIRVDRWYSSARRASCFQLANPKMRFKQTTYGGNLHCSSAPEELLKYIIEMPVRLLHYGYMHKEDRIRKFHFYNQVDPHNEFEDHYKHMVIGDLFPAESALKWAGPLQVAEI
jgi:glycosyltransferase involved in cell wall biosynthesis